MCKRNSEKEPIGNHLITVVRNNSWAEDLDRLSAVLRKDWEDY